jgi:hypothetical protein
MTSTSYTEYFPRRIQRTCLEKQADNGPEIVQYEKPEVPESEQIRRSPPFYAV